MEISHKKIFEVLKYDKVFFKYYLKDYFKRYLFNSKDVNLVTTAFLKFNQSDLDLKALIDLGDYINYNFKVFGLRNFNYPEEEKEILYFENHSSLFSRMQTLFNCYHNFWSDIDVLEKEAYFHIQLMRIVPFACNNKLICELTLISNLINNNFNPFILTKNDYEIYNNSIMTSDALKYKNIIEKRSKDELKKMVDLYKNFYHLPQDKDIKEIILLKV